LSSAAQVAYARRAFGPDTGAFVRSLVSRLEAAPGQFVALRDPSLPPEAEQPPEIAPFPQRVAVLVDGGTVSAAEVLVLEALRSTRAVVIGEPTAGALDYQSVNVIRLLKDEDRWSLGYPTIVRHPHISPEGRMQGIGIRPDVLVKWSGVGDDYGEVVKILSSLEP
ncbi:MAG TPA: S41 family peptidase, partial [Gemmatimonadales bacterium]|nr:S41 family peptidase [Gemmatimonadales bacterium]